jgi:hypothetical protein
MAYNDKMCIGIVKNDLMLQKQEKEIVNSIIIEVKK